MEALGRTRKQWTFLDPDAHLMQCVQADEPGAFEKLVERYQRRLLGFLYRQVDSRDDAEELAQEVFLRVYRTRQSYRAQSRFSTWLFAIAKNLARNIQRSQHRKPIVHLYDRDADLWQLQPAEQIFHASADPPERRLEREELAMVVRRAVAGLKRRQRLVILLNNFEGKGYEDIARCMGLTPQAVKSLLWRARTNLREALQGYVHQDSGFPFAVVAQE